MKNRNFWKDFAITCGVLTGSFILSLMVDNVFQTRSLIPTLFVLGVFLVSMMTSGYLWGISASLISVLAVNFAFTFPEFKFNFSIPENLVSAVIMLIITTVTSALTTKVKAQEKLKADTAQKEELAGKLQREPTISEIAKVMDEPHEDIVLALESIQEPVSLFEPVFHDDGDAIYVMDQVKDNKNTDEQWIENISLSEAMKKLSPRERHILNLRFFEGKTQMEVAEEISISQAQVSRLEENALKFMRKYV